MQRERSTSLRKLFKARQVALNAEATATKEYIWSVKYIYADSKGNRKYNSMCFFFSLLFWLTNFNKGINKVRINNVLQTLVWSVVIMRSILDLHVIFITKIKNMFIACVYSPIYHTALFHLWAIFLGRQSNFIWTNGKWTAAKTVRTILSWLQFEYPVRMWTLRSKLQTRQVVGGKLFGNFLV